MSDALTKAMAKADSMVMRAKAAASPIAGITSSENRLGDPETKISHAAEQYRHNRGWVYACVKLVAQRVAGQRICVAKKATTKRTDGGMVTKALQQSLPLRFKGMADDLEPLDSHAILDLLADPWSLGVAAGLMMSTVGSLELTGRSLWFLTEEEEGGRLSIFPIPTSWIEDVDRARTAWKIRMPGSAQTVPLPGDRCVYFYYPDPSNPWGALAPLQAISSAVNSDEAISTSQYRTFTNGQWPGLILTAGRLDQMPGMSGQGPRPVLTTEQRRQLVNTVKAAASGALNRNEPFIIDGLIERIDKLTFSPQELDFLNSAKLTKDKILQCFHVSEILLGAAQNANRASATVASEIFVDYKVNPLLELMSQTLTAWLGPMFGEGLVVWIEQAEAHDADMHFRKWSAALGRGTVTDDEYRVHVLNIKERPAAAKPDPAVAAAPAAPSAPATADVQATALNGAQIDSLLNIAQLVSDGTLTREAAKALIEAAFPLLSAEQINAIVNALEVNPAVTPQAAQLAKMLDPYRLKRTASNG